MAGPRRSWPVTRSPPGSGAVAGPAGGDRGDRPSPRGPVRPGAGAGGCDGLPRAAIRSCRRRGGGLDRHRTGDPHARAGAPRREEPGAAPTGVAPVRWATVEPDRVRAPPPAGQGCRRGWRMRPAGPGPPTSAAAPPGPPAPRCRQRGPRSSSPRRRGSGSPGSSSLASGGGVAAALPGQPDAPARTPLGPAPRAACPGHPERPTHPRGMRGCRRPHPGGAW